MHRSFRGVLSSSVAIAQHPKVERGTSRKAFGAANEKPAASRRKIGEAVFGLLSGRLIDAPSLRLPIRRLCGSPLLNLRHLAELAGLTSVHALHVVESSAGVNPLSLARWRDLSERRRAAWSILLEQPIPRDDPMDQSNPRCRLVEEILVSEILTRVCVAVLTALGQQTGDQTPRRVASLVFNDHQEARRMALTHMVRLADDQNPAVRPLDRLRRLAERWTDVLLGPLACRFAVGHLTFDLERSQEFGQGTLPHLFARGGLGASSLVMAGLRVAFPITLEGVPSHAGFHRDVAAAVLRLFPCDAFQKDGSLLTLRRVRAERSASRPESTPSPPKTNRPSAPKLSPVPGTPLGISFSQLRRRHQL